MGCVMQGETTKLAVNFMSNSLIVLSCVILFNPQKRAFTGASLSKPPHDRYSPKSPVPTYMYICMYNIICVCV